MIAQKGHHLLFGGVKLKNEAGLFFQAEEGKMPKAGATSVEYMNALLISTRDKAAKQFINNK
jgi:hypothetical protein